MHAATARKSSGAHAIPIGTGALHQALEDQRDHDRLQRFCTAQGVAPADVCTADGKRLDILRVFATARARGITVADPVRSQTQLKRGLTTWVVELTLPEGASLQLGFYTAAA